jgi:hypothetical protein
VDAIRITRNPYAGQFSEAKYYAFDHLSFANELNSFYARFDVRDETKEMSEILESLRNSLADHECPSFKVEDVRRTLKSQRQSKAPGPDGISGRVIKQCGDQLAGILTTIFNQSLKLCAVPSQWKLSNLVPVPKPPIPMVKNDLRPVALTDLMMKSLSACSVRISLQKCLHIRPITICLQPAVRC